MTREWSGGKKGEWDFTKGNQDNEGGGETEVGVRRNLTRLRLTSARHGGVGLPLRSRYTVTTIGIIGDC